ncbi:putative ORFan [Tupanvirus deep ocean]|uniref:ORFan n=1 Tax=Tupanvirus soda lake TaxID=2126985 RepID=A0A2K9L1Z8_9VIRU|nr:putative ORFan [Tupanvirus deep ocean]AUL79777.2 putative ORFan [Tupanvirus deep ocean]
MSCCKKTFTFDEKMNKAGKCYVKKCHDSSDSDSSDSEECPKYKKQYKCKKVKKCHQRPVTTNCDCSIYRCQNNTNQICPEVTALIDQLNNAINTRNVAALNQLLADNVVFTIYFAGQQPVVGKAAVIQALQNIIGLTTSFVRNTTNIIQEDCNRFLTLGTFNITKNCPTGPIILAPVNSVIRLTIGCENGQLKVTQIEVWADLTTLLAPCPVV